MMKQILEWLKAKISPLPAAVEVEQPNRVKHNYRGMEAPMPNIYTRNKPIKQPQVELVHELVPDADESVGFDPYDTGGFNTPKTPE